MGKIGYLWDSMGFYGRSIAESKRKKNNPQVFAYYTHHKNVVVAVAAYGHPLSNGNSYNPIDKKTAPLA
ncbi:MAG: hypothetical protein KDJ15_05885 [Alphaproteobacteria bacterium]|nr:hypothetical protein [Alphaproteobacteria bacterium]